MKNIKLFNKILLSISIIFIILILILFILGNIERKGYLSDISISTDDTLKLNNIEDAKKLFYVNDELDYSLLTNYIFTNSNISNYSYNFRISYYSKVFRNSDIYGVYLNTNSLANYIKNIKFEKKGSPFGILISDELIEGNIDNIQYSLKIKFSFYIMILLIFIVLSFLTYILRNFILNLLTFLSYIINSNITKYVFVLIIFLCFLIIPNILYFLFGNYFDKTNYENRVFASKPKLDLKNLGDYPKLYETHFNDYIPFKNELVQLKNLMDIFIFKSFINNTTTQYSYRDRILLGKNNWLFHKWNDMDNIYIGNNIFSDYELNTTKNNLLYFRDELKKRNIDFILMICQDKNTIYDIYMPDYIKRKSTISAIDKFVNYMNDNTDIDIVYPKKELLKYRDRYQLYYKYDSHWNPLGAYLGYLELMKYIDFSYYNNQISNLNVISKNTSVAANDIANFLSLSGFTYFKKDVIYSPDITNYNKLISYYDVKNWSDLKTSSESYIIDKNILIIRDSFASAMENYISHTFSNVEYIHIDNFSKEVIETNSFDIVIFEVVERFLKDRLLYVLPNYKIEEINKDLETNSIVPNN